MIQYDPTTPAGRAALDAANEVMRDLTQGDLLARVPLPPMVAPFRSSLEPFVIRTIGSKAAELVTIVDRDPEAARSAVVPLIRRVIAGLGLTPADLFEEAEA